MTEQPHKIDVMVSEGHNGAVHVRTPEDMDDVVESQFAGITERLGDVALTAAADEVYEEQEDSVAQETGADREARALGKMNRSHFKGHPPHPSKAKK